MSKLNTSKALLTGMTLSLLTACGGGSDDNEGGGGGGANNESNGNTEGSRVSVLRTDLDNNGTFEGEATYSYDSGGRLVKVESTYTDDGTPDHEFDSIRMAVTDSITEYTYDADGNPIQQVTTYLEGGDGNSLIWMSKYESTLTWEDGLVTEIQSQFLDSEGGSYGIDTTRIDYDDTGRLTKVTTEYGTPDEDYTVYDYEGESDLPSSYQHEDSSIQEFTWSGDRQLLETNEYYIFSEPVRLNSTDTYQYDESGRLTATVRTYPDTPEHEDDLPYTSKVVYEGDNWKPIKGIIDEELDQNPEAVTVWEYEDGPCEASHTFTPRGGYTATKTETFQPGVGYYPLNRCYQD